MAEGAPQLHNVSLRPRPSKQLNAISLATHFLA